MALPKKRKKLSNSENTLPIGNTTSPDMDEERKNLKKPRAKGTARKKSGEKMNKAFEIIEQIESNNGLPGSAVSADNHSASGKRADTGHAEPGKIQFRISLDGAITGSNNKSGKTTIDYDKPHVIDFGITIPSFVWKVPFLKKAAQKMIQKLSSKD
jgi:hypothetical protein